MQHASKLFFQIQLYELVLFLKVDPEILAEALVFLIHDFWYFSAQSALDLLQIVVQSDLKEI